MAGLKRKKQTSALSLIACILSLLVLTNGNAQPTQQNSPFDITIGGDRYNCSANELTWCPSGDLNYIVIEIELHDGSPSGGWYPFTTLKLDYEYRIDPATPPSGNPGTIYLVGGDAPGNVTEVNQSITLVTDSFGYGVFYLWGGGTGSIEIDYTLSYRLEGSPPNDPFVVLIESNPNDPLSYCVRSTDANGSGNVNFFDTFWLLAEQGQGGTPPYLTDFNCDGVANFFDNFIYLPHLNAGHFIAIPAGNAPSAGAVSQSCFTGSGSPSVGSQPGLDDSAVESTTWGQLKKKIPRE